MRVSLGLEIWYLVLGMSRRSDLSAGGEGEGGRVGEGQPLAFAVVSVNNPESRLTEYESYSMNSMG